VSARVEKFNVSAAVAGLRVAEDHLLAAARFLSEPIGPTTECPLCGLHPSDFTVEEYKRELERCEERLAVARVSSPSRKEDG
jgi:hypothetical protein